MRESIKAIKDVAEVLFTKDGKVLTLEEAIEGWTYETAARVAGALQNNGYSAEKALRLDPENEVEFIWHIEDVKDHAANMCNWPGMTDEEARDILEVMKRRHDCTIGINWDVIDYYVEDAKYEKEKANAD